MAMLVYFVLFPYLLLLLLLNITNNAVATFLALILKFAFVVLSPETIFIIVLLTKHIDCKSICRGNPGPCLFHVDSVIFCFGIAKGSGQNSGSSTESKETTSQAQQFKKYQSSRGPPAILR